MGCETLADESCRHRAGVTKVRPMSFHELGEVCEAMFGEGDQLVIDRRAGSIECGRVRGIEALVRRRAVCVSVVDRVGGGDEQGAVVEEPFELVDTGQRRRVVTDQERVAAHHIDPASDPIAGQREHGDEAVE